MKKREWNPAEPCGWIRKDFRFQLDFFTTLPTCTTVTLPGDSRLVIDVWPSFFLSFVGPAFGRILLLQSNGQGTEILQLPKPSFHEKTREAKSPIF